jgi:hypothetical protein
VNKNEDLQGTDQIINKIACLGGNERFNHGKPADFLLCNRDKYLEKLSENTLANF